MVPNNERARIGRTVTIGLVVVILVAVAISVYAVLLKKPTPACGALITANTTLSANIGPCSFGGLDVGANGITLNCNGHTISGTSTNTYKGIYLNGRTGVTVKNCKVTKFEVGFDLHLSSHDTLSNNTADKNTAIGFDLSNSSSNRLTTNQANDNLGYGFYLQSSSYNTLSGNIANNNSPFGFWLYFSSGNILSGNIANNNTQQGFLLSRSFLKNTLSGNTANNNKGYGYYDTSRGSGTAGTTNVYTGDECSGNRVGGSNPNGLCLPS